MNTTVKQISKAITPEEHHFWLLVEERLAHKEEMHIHRFGSMYQTVLKFKLFGMVKLRKCRIHENCSKIAPSLSWTFTPSSTKEKILMATSESNILKIEQAQ
ncbi:MAG: hypothetical protein JWN25_3001 [Verrucomicrobiales bacterium]|jgi:hypothetical protein|nr:hypothetical protein [Verrucomicrobiales bacterium]